MTIDYLAASKLGADDLRHHRPASMSLDMLSLAFSVSEGQRSIRLRLLATPSVWDLGTRAHNRILLTLARRRLGDLAEGASEGAAGWVYTDELSQEGISLSRLNTYVCRLRKQLARIGITNADDIVERRMGSRQLRIGTSRILIAKA